MMAKPVCVVIGVGPGLGFASARAFAKSGYSIALCSRSLESMKTYAKQLTDAGFEAAPFSCDVSSRDSIESCLSEVKKTFRGLLTVAIMNATAGMAIKPFDEIDPAVVQTSLNVNGMGCFHFLQVAGKQMLDHKQGGSLLVTGSTASIRASEKFGSFAAGQFARRALCISAAKSLGPRGIHVAHFVIDGGIGEDDARMHPDSIAKIYVQTAEQDKSTWAFEVDLRPSVEKW